MIKENCPFCNPQEFIRPHFGEYGVDPALDKIPLFQGDHFAVFPDVLPVNPEGHFLVVPRDHRHSLHHFSSQADELGSLLRVVEAKLGLPLAFFEHGGSEDQKGKIQSVLHAHGHIIPVRDGIDVLGCMAEAIGGKGIPFRLVDNLDYSPLGNLPGLNGGGKGYLYVQYGRQGLFAADQEDTFPSQLTQGTMSQLLNGEVINWRQIPDKEILAILSVQRVVKIVEQCQR